MPPARPVARAARRTIATAGRQAAGPAVRGKIPGERAGPRFGPV